jgi:flagellar protein FliO/FliZ
MYKEGNSVNGSHLLLQAVPRGYLEGYTSDILQALLALLGVCALAVWVIRLTASRFPRLGLVQGPVRVEQRIPLEPRRTLYLVRVGSRLLLLGFGETQGPILLAEIDPQSIPTGMVAASEPPKGITERLNLFIHRNRYDRGIR